MTTLSPISSSLSPILRLAGQPLAAQPRDTPVADRPSSVVSLGNVVSDTLSSTYSVRGQLPGQAPPLAWETDSHDTLSKAINTNFNALSIANRFKGLGDSLVAQFAEGGTDISQSVRYAGAESAGELKLSQSLLHSKADNLVSLNIKTASGKTITFSLSSQSDGLGVQAAVDGGTLSDDELKASVS